MTAPHPDYLVRAFPLVPSDQPVDADPTPVDDAEAAFVRLRTRGDHLVVWDGGKIPPGRYTGANDSPAGRAVIHIQGVQRLQDGAHYVLSGGDTHEDVSHLFIARVGSEGSNQPFGSNVRDRRTPPEGDKIVNIIGLRNTHWHAGGISVLGDVLAVPLEAPQRQSPAGGEPAARVLFVHLRDPLSPQVFPNSTGIECAGPKAGAVALTRLPNGHFLCAVWSDKGGLEFYVSHESGTFSGFGPGRQWTAGRWKYRDALGGRKAPQYQSIGFLWQAGGSDPVPDLFLVGTGSTAQPSIGVFGGFDYADLFRVELPPALLASPPVPGVTGFPAPELTRIRECRFTGGGEFSHMAAGGGVYVSPSGTLCVYGAYHYRLASLFRMCEYRSELATLPDPAHCWVDLFEHDRFRGRRLSVIGMAEASIPRYDEINVQGEGLDEKVSSARWQLPAGSTYRLFRARDFQLNGSNRDFIDLVGTGAVEEIENFADHKASFGDCVSSSRFR